MVENTGNSYRTRQAVLACTALIAIAVAVLLVGYYELSVLIGAGVFLLMIGTVVAVMSFTFSKTPDKFGPSEMNFRLIAGLVMAVVGAFLLMLGYEVETYICIAALIIAIAVIGLCATFLGNKTSKY